MAISASRQKLPRGNGGKSHSKDFFKKTNSFYLPRCPVWLEGATGGGSNPQKGIVLSCDEDSSGKRFYSARILEGCGSTGAKIRYNIPSAQLRYRPRKMEENKKMDSVAGRTGAAQGYNKPAPVKQAHPGHSKDDTNQARYPPSTSAQRASDGVTNVQANPFQNISRRRHQMERAKSILRPYLTRGRHDDNISRSVCWWYHLEGFCVKGKSCPRTHDMLTPSQARDLEDSLARAISPNGPIFSKGDGGGGFKKRHLEDSHSRDYRSDRCNDDKRRRTTTEPYTTSRPIARTEVEHFLPAFLFGADFFQEVIDSARRSLEAKYDCSIHLGPAGRSSKLLLRVVGNSKEQLWNCIHEVEIRLVNALPRKLRGRLLSQLAIANETHGRGIVYVRDPCAFNLGLGSDYRHLNVIPLGPVGNQEKYIVPWDLVQDGTIQRAHPRCHLLVVEHKNPAFPAVKPFVLISGTSHDAVKYCRADIFIRAFGPRKYAS
ncbi:expressed unknown protein [Seminavis robusta]|uniref:C3H1-type domain-containing protein n=1 Tax=Seminavis robusta TaxID=568900 RepID=A0A9N8HIG7_9STRA|nr:expressed unknown protein [Seminavis robusta]|eukprot:Sro594_g172390.1 n/a (488) ;mRNA; f:9276-10739